MKFNYQNPTNVQFGAGAIDQLGETVARYGKKALIVTGGGSVKKTGVFEKAVNSLKKSGVSYAECSGVEPNPRITSVARGVETIRKENCDALIALGGGSVMDAAKVMAVACFHDGDPWDLILHGQAKPVVPQKGLPIITVPTLAATGSEMNHGAVISNDDTKIKSFIQHNLLYPKVAVVDPELTLSVPTDQTAYGVSDMIVHVTEPYFNGQGGTPLQDRFMESVIITAMEFGKRAVKNGGDLEAREQVQWASIVALNGWTSLGTAGGFPVHMIEHALSGHHNVTHGAGLSIVNPAWMRFAARAYPNKFVQFAERIFGLKASSDDDLATALAGIDRYENFLKEIGCPTRLSEVGIGDALLERYAKDSMLVATDGKGNLFGKPMMSVTDIVATLRTVL